MRSSPMIQHPNKLATCISAILASYMQCIGSIDTFAVTTPLLRTILKPKYNGILPDS